MFVHRPPGPAAPLANPGAVAQPQQALDPLPGSLPADPVAVHVDGLEWRRSTPAYYGKRNRQHRWQVLARTMSPADLLSSLDLPREVMVDVDPVSVL